VTSMSNSQHKTDWAAMRPTDLTKLTQEEARLLDMLAEGKSTPAIARETGEHRSMVWRKVQRLKSQLLANSHQ
jgi:DNA-binding NarL/FixJ family response regulator